MQNNTPNGPPFHSLRPVPVQVRTNTQSYRETCAALRMPPVLKTRNHDTLAAKGHEGLLGQQGWRFQPLEPRGWRRERVQAVWDTEEGRRLRLICRGTHALQTLPPFPAHGRTRSIHPWQKKNCREMTACESTMQRRRGFVFVERPRLLAALRGASSAASEIP